MLIAAQKEILPGNPHNPFTTIIGLDTVVSIIIIVNICKCYINLQQAKFAEGFLKSLV